MCFAVRFCVFGCEWFELDFSVAVYGVSGGFDGSFGWVMWLLCSCYYPFVLVAAQSEYG